MYRIQTNGVGAKSLPNLRDSRGEVSGHAVRRNIKEIG
jgi:hypothetical protein